MKRTIAITAAFLLLAAWGCKKDKPEVPDVPGAPSALTLSGQSFDAGADGGTFSLTVTAPSRPKVSGQPDWVNVTDGTFKDYSITYSLNVSANTDYSDREAVLTVTSGTLSKSFTVRQAAARKPEEPPVPDFADVDENLTNPNASAAACRVYDFLRENAGKRVISGVQSGDTANNNDRVNEVFKMTGRHPALAGYDYIFLQYSPTPSSWSWKVDYGDISAPKEQWKAGGLVSFMWHWNVPTSETAWANGLKGNFDGYNFYVSNTAFSISRALTPGTWENEFLLKDIEKVAGYLKLLQQEGIPVLWRPLHEAAGNYNVYGSNGAWFWWGRGGAESCKQLWKLLRDKLEGEYGLDNLIWVWTLDATVGAEEDYASWYPGNDLVDIVGVDIYADDTAAKPRQHEAAVALSGGHKLVTISECGNIPDPSACLSGGEKWNWFLVWSLDESEYSHNTTSYWKALMSSNQVFTRENMPSLK